MEMNAVMSTFWKRVGIRPETPKTKRSDPEPGYDMPDLTQNFREPKETRGQKILDKENVV